MSGAARTLLLGFVAGSAGWVYSGSFQPLVGDDVDFLFFSLGLTGLLAWWLGAAAAIALVHAICSRRIRGLDRSYLAPLWLFAFALVPDWSCRPRCTFMQARGRTCFSTAADCLRPSSPG